MRVVGLALAFLFTFPAAADELKLHIMKSPVGVNWSSPWALTMSVLKNQIAPVGGKRKFSISHVIVEVKCNSVGKHIYRGMTSATTTEERDLVFNQKYGLGTMFHTYAGLLEKEEDIFKGYEPYAGNKRRSELAIKVSPEACERMLQYAQEYEDLGYGKMYSGLQADPLKREGAGCSAFAMSFMRVAGLMDNFTEEWKQKIHIPLRFIGGPMTGKKVNIITLLTKPFATWNKNEPHYYLEAWDPELMHKWVRKTYFEVINNEYEGSWPANVSREKNTLKVELNMENRETPEGEFWI